MRPVEGLAIDVFLQQTLAHHQAEIFPRPPPRRIGAFIDDVAQIIQPPRRCGLARLQPGFPRQAAFPGPSGKAQNFDLDAAALQRAGQNIGACRRHRDWPAAHRPGIVEQQRHHRIAEIHVLLALERQRLLRVDDDARQARRIEHAFFKVELPRTILLRHQTALQAIGKTRHDGRQVLQLLVEIGAQPLEFLGLAQVLGMQDFVMLVGKGLVIRSALLGRIAGRATAFSGFISLARIRLFREFAGRRVFGLHRAFFHLVGGFLGFLHVHAVAGLVLVALAGLILRVVAGLVLVAVVVLVLAVDGRIIAHVQRVQQFVNRLAKSALVFDIPRQPVEIAARPRLDPVAP